MANRYGMPSCPSLRHIALLVLLFGALARFGQAYAIDRIEFPSFSTSYRIELLPNCSALWSIMYSVPLSGTDDEARFEAYIQNFTASKVEFLQSFEQDMVSVVEQASNMTDRTMSAQGFDVIAVIINTPTISRGTITYRFLWTNFLEEALPMLYMGDVFEGGLYLYENDSLTVVPPSGFRASFASPQPDALGGIISWHGPRNFTSGEPAMEFQSMATSITISLEHEELAQGDQVVVLGRIEPPLAVLVNVTFSRPDGGTISQTATTSALGQFTSTITADEVGTWIAQASWDGNGEYLGSASQVITLPIKSAFNYALVPLILLPVIVVTGLMVLRRRARLPVESTLGTPRSDEENVLALLKSAGGQMLQKDIGRTLGFSKSKTTAILNGLEASNLIEKEKRGRQYLVKLR